MTILIADAMPRPRRLPRAHEALIAEHLDDALAELADLSHARFARHADRLALCFAHLPAGPERRDPLAALLPPVVRLGQLRAVALTLRFCEAVAGGPPRRRAALAVSAPLVDLPGSGRISWVPESVVDLRSRPGRRSLDPALKRVAVLLAQGLLDRPSDELLDAPVLPELRWGFAPACPPPPEIGFDDLGWMDLQEPHEGLATWPHECLARTADEADGAAPMPLQVLADCRAVRGEVIRNPAALAIGRKGFDPYLGRTAQEFRREAGGAFGPALEAAALEVAAAASGIDEPGQDARYRAILDEILGVLGALGAGLPGDPAAPEVRALADDRLATVTTAVPAPWAPRVQAVRIRGGVPSAASCAFGTPTMELDLSELGPEQSGWYRPLRPRRSRRGGRPDRPSRLRR